MKVVILCGGYGTRISDVAGDNPKPMVPIGPYPIVWHIMKGYSTYGYNDFILYRLVTYQVHDNCPFQLIRK